MIDRDFPTNEVQQIVAHKTNLADGELHLLVQWLGFTKADRTWENANELVKQVPGHVRAYMHDNMNKPECRDFFSQHFLWAAHPGGDEFSRSALRVWLQSHPGVPNNIDTWWLRVAQERYTLRLLQSCWALLLQRGARLGSIYKPTGFMGAHI